MQYKIGQYPTSPRTKATHSTSEWSANKSRKSMSVGHSFSAPHLLRPQARASLQNTWTTGKQTNLNDKSQLQRISAETKLSDAMFLAESKKIEKFEKLCTELRQNGMSIPSLNAHGNTKIKKLPVILIILLLMSQIAPAETISSNRDCKEIVSGLVTNKYATTIYTGSVDKTEEDDTHPLLFAKKDKVESWDMIKKRIRSECLNDEIVTVGSNRNWDLNDREMHSHIPHKEECEAGRHIHYRTTSKEYGKESGLNKEQRRCVKIVIDQEENQRDLTLLQKAWNAYIKAVEPFADWLEEKLYS